MHPKTFTCPICGKETLKCHYSSKYNIFFYVCDDIKCVSPLTKRRVFYEVDKAGNPVIESCSKDRGILENKRSEVVSTKNEQCQTYEDADSLADGGFGAGPKVISHLNQARLIVDNQSEEQIMRGVEYIRNHEEINEVIISGGSTLMLNNKLLNTLLWELSLIYHITRILIYDTDKKEFCYNAPVIRDPGPLDLGYL